jgi:hypothetical protein
MTISLRTVLSAALLSLAACGSGGDEAANAAADSAAVVPARDVDVVGTADDRARDAAGVSDAAVQARDSAVDALSRDAAGGN